MDNLINLLTNEDFWKGVTALAAIVVPVATPYIVKVRRTSKQLIKLHNLSPEHNTIIKNRAEDFKFKAAHKVLKKKL